MKGQFNPYSTNGFSHHYHLSESTVMSDLHFLFIFFFDENPLSNRINRIAPDGYAAFWGYAVCLCPIKGTSGLNELMLQSLGLISFTLFVIGFEHVTWTVEKSLVS